MTKSSEKAQEQKVCITLKCLQEEKREPKVEKVVPHKRVEKKVVVKKEPPKKLEKAVVKRNLKKPPSKKTPPKKEIQKRSEKIRKKTLPKKVVEQKILKKKEVKVVKKVSQEELYLQNHLQEILQLLQEHLYYPRRARKRGIEGDVLIRFYLSQNAEVSEIEVLSSKKEILSRAAIKTLENLSREFPAPQRGITLKIPISYRLK